MNDAGLESTLQHIGMLDSRRRRLVAAQLEAEEQLLHRVGVMYQAGQLTEVELIEIYEACRAFKTPGMSKRWTTHVGMPWGRLQYLARQLPNGPEGTWVGIAPLSGDDPAPREGTPVVYVLFDDANEPCYVGSTANLRTRLGGHLTQGKSFVSWQAYACEDREAAYVLEERLLAERMPRLNRRAGR